MKKQKFLKFFNNYKAWLYLLPAIILLSVFLIYPLIDVFIYSFEEDYNFVTETYTGIGFYNYKYVLSSSFSIIRAILSDTILFFALLLVSPIKFSVVPFNFS